MAFRKRNIGVQQGSATTQHELRAPIQQASPGVRPSPLSGRPTISTGVSSLDSYLGGHAGLATGSSLLVEETGTTDFSGALLKYFAAEGIAQSQHLQIVGISDQWVRELPGLGRSSDSKASLTSVKEDKMKIAWRYERLGQHDAGRAGGVVPSRGPQAELPNLSEAAAEEPFCHTFDLAKRLVVAQSAHISHIRMDLMITSTKSPFADVIKSIVDNVCSSPPASVHRIIIPSILSPAFYPPHASNPEHFLQFLHSLRSLLRQYPDRLTAMITLPTELYSRSSGLVRWAEHLSDGVIELQPFPHIMDESNSLAESGGARTNEDQPQGMLKFHKMPDLTERGASGVGSASLGDDLSFTLSRRRFTIRPFSLPPMEREESQAVKGEAAGAGALGGAKKADIEF